MRKLTIISDTFLPRWDGVSRFLIEIIPRLKKKYNLKIIVPDFGKINIDLKIIKVPLSKFKINDFEFSKFDFSIKKEIKQSDILFINSLGPIGILSMLYGNKFNKPIITYIHSIDWDLWSRSIGKFRKMFRKISILFTKWLYNKSTMIIVPYPEVISLLKKHNIKKPNFAIVRLGVDTNKFKPVNQDQKNKLREKYDLKKDKIIIGYIGRVTREKGIETLIKTFELLKKDNENIQLLIAGKGIPQIIETIKNKPGIIYRNLNEDAKEILQTIDIFVLPSLTETTSLITIEAMSCEKIVIASAVGYIKQYIEDKKNGFTFNRENFNQLRIKLKYAIENINNLEYLKKNARITVLNRFNWNNTANEMIKIFDEF